MTAQINVDGTNYDKSFLISSRDGQAVLRNAKDSPTRPLCLCSSPPPSMYISRRGGHFFLSRMPGSANAHDLSCRSHIVDFNSPDLDAELTADEVMKQILDLLAPRLPAKHNWGTIRETVIQLSALIKVDGALLSSRLLVPLPFDRNKIAEHNASYDSFYALQSTDHDKQVRYWTFGVLKECIERPYSFQATLKHMPSTKFWVQKDVASTFPSCIPDLTQVICLFSCRKVKTGVEVDEAAAVLVNDDLLPVNAISAPTAAQILQAKEILGLPNTAREEDVFAALVHRLLFPKQ